MQSVSSEKIVSSEFIGVEHIGHALSSKRIAISVRRDVLSKDTLTQSVYLYFLKTIGDSKRPVVVPMADIAKETLCTYNQVRKRIKILIEAGLLEKWTVKHPTQFKITYYRVAAL